MAMCGGISPQVMYDHGGWKIPLISSSLKSIEAGTFLLLASEYLASCSGADFLCTDMKLMML